ncbi:MAG: hypothetical protein R2805_05615 [Flavobacterium sp.]|jgi:toxin ParE1/3/4|uniref:hypothetical protein n=1 Tax=Flavobacterium sp. TaxID=239 RepID=UPI003527FDA7
MINFTKEALLDIEEIVIWYEEQRIGLSFDFEMCLEAGLSEINRNPDSYQKRFKNVKIKFINRFPFGIHYINFHNEITILAIFHTSRSPKKWTNRI